jgi:hypothetical protein
MQINLQPVEDSLGQQHRVFISRDGDRGDYLVEADVKAEGGIRHCIYRTPDKTTVIDVLNLVRRSGRSELPISPRPYQLAQACDGSIVSPVLALFVRFCESRGLDPTIIMVGAYPDESSEWHVEYFRKIVEEAEWQGVAYPACWDSAAVAGLVESLHAINYHQLAGLIGDMPDVCVCPESLSGKEVVALMRKHKKTIAGLSSAMNLSQARVRHMREHGVSGKAFVQDWVEAISA